MLPPALPLTQTMRIISPLHNTDQNNQWNITAATDAPLPLPRLRRHEAAVTG